MTIPSLVKEMEIDEIIITMPSAPKSEIRKILDICKKTKCKLKTLPGVYELIDGKVQLITLEMLKLRTC
jgi:FlaA1/EpsC-like NDP-sugar epimerase